MLIKSIPTLVSNRHQCGGTDTLVSVPSQAAVVANCPPFLQRIDTSVQTPCSSSSPALLCSVPQTTDAITDQGREKAERNPETKLKHENAKLCSGHESIFTFSLLMMHFPHKS